MREEKPVERYISIEKEDDEYILKDSKTRIANQGESLPSALRNIADAIELAEDED